MLSPPKNANKYPTHHRSSEPLHQCLVSSPCLQLTIKSGGIGVSLAPPLFPVNPSPEPSLPSGPTGSTTEPCLLNDAIGVIISKSPGVVPRTVETTLHVSDISTSIGSGSSSGSG